MGAVSETCRFGILESLFRTYSIECSLGISKNRVFVAGVSHGNCIVGNSNSIGVVGSSVYIQKLKSIIQYLYEMQSVAFCYAIDEPFSNIDNLLG